MLPVIVPQLGQSNVSNKLENVLKDVDKLNADFKRTVARMYHAMSTSQWTVEEEITERALISLFEKQFSRKHFCLFLKEKAEHSRRSPLNMPIIWWMQLKA